MVEMVHRALERLDRLGRDAEFLLRQVAEHRNRTRGTDAPVLAQRLDLGLALLADQEMDHGSLARKQLANQALADESGRARHEIMHVSSSLVAGGLFTHGILAEKTPLGIQH